MKKTLKNNACRTLSLWDIFGPVAIEGNEMKNNNHE